MAIVAAMHDLLTSVPLEELRDHVAGMDSEESTCRTCDKPIRTTPAVHKDGSVHWASSGWEHTETEQSSCGKRYPYCWAQPIGDE